MSPADAVAEAAPGSEGRFAGLAAAALLVIGALVTLAATFVGAAPLAAMVGTLVIVVGAALLVASRPGSAASAGSPFPRSVVSALVGAGGLVLLLSFLIFARTAEPVVLFLGFAGLLLLALVALARWVYVDAAHQGMPGIPWALLVVLAPVLGLLAYLVVREMRRKP